MKKFKGPLCILIGIIAFIVGMFILVNPNTLRDDLALKIIGGIFCIIAGIISFIYGANK